MNLFQYRLANLAVLFCSFVAANSTVVAEETFRPSDPIASVDGEPILLGELNFLLSTKLKVKDLSAVNIEVQRASCASLVRQHLAMKSLRQQGGADLQSILNRDWEEFVVELRRKGSDIDQICDQTMSDEQSVRQSHDWDSAWRRYLKSMMTDANLKRYYALHPDKYASTRWNVSHLFLPIDKENLDSDEIGEQRIQEITRQLQSQSGSPESLKNRFAELAIKESEGVTAKAGGSIGWVSSSGDLPVGVMEAIRETATGSISKPVRSPLGYHLILVHEKASDEVPFEKITDLNPIRRDAANALFEALVAGHSNAKVTWYIKTLQPPTKHEQTTSP